MPSSSRSAAPGAYRGAALDKAQQRRHAKEASCAAAIEPGNCPGCCAARARGWARRCLNDAVTCRQRQRTIATSAGAWRQREAAARRDPARLPPRPALRPAHRAGRCGRAPVRIGAPRGASMPWPALQRDFRRRRLRQRVHRARIDLARGAAHARDVHRDHVDQRAPLRRASSTMAMAGAHCTAAGGHIGGRVGVPAMLGVAREAVGEAQEPSRPRRRCSARRHVGEVGVGGRAAARARSRSDGAALGFGGAVLAHAAATARRRAFSAWRASSSAAKLAPRRAIHSHWRGRAESGGVPARVQCRHAFAFMGCPACRVSDRRGIGHALITRACRRRPWC